MVRGSKALRLRFKPYGAIAQYAQWAFPNRP